MCVVEHKIGQGLHYCPTWGLSPHTPTPTLRHEGSVLGAPVCLSVNWRHDSRRACRLGGYVPLDSQLDRCTVHAPCGCTNEGNESKKEVQTSEISQRASKVFSHSNNLQPKAVQTKEIGGGGHSQTALWSCLIAAPDSKRWPMEPDRAKQRLDQDRA